MSPENFCYWLQGYFELYGPKTIDEKETRVVWDHLKLVFSKLTPDRTFNSKNPESPTLNYPDALREWNKNNPNKPLIC